MPLMSETCLFCRIVAGEIPAQIVAQNDQCIAFRDVAPQAPLHVLVVPRAHVASLSAGEDAAMIGAVAMLAAQVARDAGYAERGFRTVVNDGPDAGQTVSHLHMHVLAGRPLAWPPG
ncbi:histidine triad nucleotide-binding protein [Gemmatimonadetes bacterium T265]|nr:histidine triad nucleotide-binding protein [Gemmatimonadetes bacterium T265]